MAPGTSYITQGYNRARAHPHCVEPGMGPTPGLSPCWGDTAGPAAAWSSLMGREWAAIPLPWVSSSAPSLESPGGADASQQPRAPESASPPSPASSPGRPAALRHDRGSLGAPGLPKWLPAATRPCKRQSRGPAGSPPSPRTRSPLTSLRAWGPRQGGRRGSRAQKPAMPFTWWRGVGPGASRRAGAGPGRSGGGRPAAAQPVGPLRLSLGKAWPRADGREPRPIAAANSPGLLSRPIRSSVSGRRRD